MGYQTLLDDGAERRPRTSLVRLGQENGVSRNPFTNTGAPVVTDHLVGLTGDASGARRAESGDTIDFDPDSAASEAAHGDLDNPMASVLEPYFRPCSLAMSCEEVALAQRGEADRCGGADVRRRWASSPA